MVDSTVARSSVEFTACVTSPSARSSPTDCASSRLRVSSSWVSDGQCALLPRTWQASRTKRSPWLASISPFGEHPEAANDMGGLYEALAHRMRNVDALRHHCKCRSLRGDSISY